MAVSFNTLNEEATIFNELNKNPLWWEKFKKDRSLYIEIRKDNQVNVYFEGGSVARIHYCSKHKQLQVFTHHKYLGITAEKPMYIECSKIINEKLDFILDQVKRNYSQKYNQNGITPKEQWSEKFIQSNLILESSTTHLDSEFAYKDNENDIRIDMVKVVDGAITFVELKRLDDPRMLKSTEDDPEVVFQLRDYEKFIESHKDELLSYYKRVYDIKKKLGLILPTSRPASVNTKAELLIFNRWEREHPARENHKRRMEKILTNANISYKIIDRF